MLAESAKALCARKLTQKHPLRIKIGFVQTRWMLFVKLVI
jgi:hypothetical protein